MTEDRWLNPYIVGQPIRDPRQFFGRDEELRAIFERIRQRGCLSLVGERKSGKTSLLYYLQDPGVLAQYLPAQPLLFVYVNAELTRTPADFLHEWFKALAAQEPGLPLDNGEEIDYRQAEERLDRLKGRRRLVVLIDEFEQLIANQFPLEFFRVLRGLISRYDLSCITATKMRLKECCPPDRTGSPFFNYFKHLPLGAFTPEEFDTFLVGTSRPYGFPAPAYGEAILDLAGRFPFFVQMACWHYFEAEMAARRLGTSVDPQQVRQAFAEEAAEHFDYIWHHLSADETANERQAVLALAQGERPVSTQVVRTLERKGYVVDGRLFSSSFAEFVEQKVGASPTKPGVSFDEHGNIVVVDNEGKRCVIPRERLTPLERDLLVLLYANKGKLCQYKEIRDKVWVPHDPGYINVAAPLDSIHQTVRRLREKIEPYPDKPCFVISVHGEGYKLVDP